MIDCVPPEILRKYPPELVRYATDEAIRDAVDVTAFLAAAGLAPPPGQTRGFPPDVLLDLGAIVRLRRWEAAGLVVHTEAGLPTAAAALTRLVAILTAAAADRTALADAGVLARSVFELTVDRFAWTAQPELGTDVVLLADDEDALIAALAPFLWTHRHDGSAA